MVDRDTDLPTTWTWITFKDAVENISTNNKKIKQKDYITFGKFPIVDQGQGLIGGYTNDESKIIFSESPLLIFGDHTKTLKYISQNFAPGAEGVKVLAPHKFFEPKLFLYFTQHLVSNLVDNGYARHYQHLEKCSIPLPPLNEQNRIVAKIEELFSELDMGLENLNKARELLKGYRQTLLKNAFEGNLTKKWRHKNLPSISSKPKNLTDQNHEITTLPLLPLDWEYAFLGQLIRCIEAGKSFKCAEREPTLHEVGVAKVSAVTWGEYDESESKTCNDPNKINSKFYIKEGDFLFSRANTIDLVGACVIVKQVKKNIMLSDKTLRIKFNIANPTYILWYLRSITGRNEIMKHSTGNQDSMRNIGQERIRSILLPMCSEDEQLEIIRILNEKLLGIENLERKINNELQRSQSLRQNILKKAFSGELVTHDTNDEPASVLLDRIKSEKTDPSSSSPKSKKLQKVVQ